MPPPTNSNESYCTFTLASDVTAGGLPSEAEIAKDLESSDDNVRFCFVIWRFIAVSKGTIIDFRMVTFSHFRLSL
jgi:hypothetical protein